MITFMRFKVQNHSHTSFVELLKGSRWTLRMYAKFSTTEELIWFDFDSSRKHFHRQHASDYLCSVSLRLYSSLCLRTRLWL